MRFAKKDYPELLQRIEKAYDDALRTSWNEYPNGQTMMCVYLNLKTESVRSTKTKRPETDEELIGHVGVSQPEMKPRKLYNRAVEMLS